MVCIIPYSYHHHDWRFTYRKHLGSSCKCSQKRFSIPTKHPFKCKALKISHTSQIVVTVFEGFSTFQTWTIKLSHPLHYLFVPSDAFIRTGSFSQIKWVQLRWPSGYGVGLEIQWGFNGQVQILLTVFGDSLQLKFEYLLQLLTDGSGALWTLLKVENTLNLGSGNIVAFLALVQCVQEVRFRLDVVLSW